MKKRAVAIGIFDGVHRAHRLLIKRTVREAKKLKAVPAVVTFDPHPRKVLSGDHKNPPILMSLEHRLRLFKSLGIRETRVVPFTKRFSQFPAEDFLERFLVKKLGACFLAVGHDFRFGYQAKGTAAYLRAHAKSLGYKLYVCPAVRVGGRILSSTAIRHDIEKGRLHHAAQMLGRPVSLYGTVVKGHGRGAELGFPTANLDPHHETLPPEGVYAVYAQLGKKRIRGVVHIGSRPTFGERDRSVEVHLLGWRGELYGRELELFFVKKLRGIRRFPSRQALTAAIRRDVAQARRVFSPLHS